MRIVALAGVCLVWLYGATARAQVYSGSSVDPSPIVLEVNGVKFTLADVESRRPALFQARSGFYQVQRKSVDEVIEDQLLEQQAKKENLTVATLLDKHVTSKLEAEPSEESLRVYYEGIDTTEPYEAVRGKIIEHLRNRRLAKAKAAYLQELRKGSSVIIRLSAPRVDVSLSGTPVRGKPTAPVVLVEFADYECAYCQQIQPVLEKIIAEYKNSLAFAYKDMPLPMHSNAVKAAEAAHCAGAQGKYWEYHDQIFSSKQLEVPQLKEQARQLSLDTKAFNACLDSGEKAQVVQNHFSDAQKLGLQGTPSFFLNGRFFSGMTTYEKLREMVEEELAASRPGTLASGSTSR